MTKNYIGIDVSAKTLEISRLVSGESKRETIKNDGESIKSWIVTFEPATFCVFEATGVYSRNLEYWLSFNKVSFSKVTPTKIKGFMKANGVLQKTDRHDAVVIRQFGEKMQPEPSRPIGEVEIEKARLEHSLAALQKQFQMIDNQIHVLDHEPIPMSEVRNALETIKHTLTEQIAVLQDKLAKYTSAHEQQAVKLMQTIKGIGPVISNLFASTTGCFEHYRSDKQVTKYFGLAPITERSGTSVNKSLGINRTAVPHVRANLYVASTSAITHNPRCRELYNRLRSRGKPPKVAKVAVMRQLVRWAFAVVKSGKPFDPNHLQTNKVA